MNGSQTDVTIRFRMYVRFTLRMFPKLNKVNLHAWKGSGELRSCNLPLHHSMPRDPADFSFKVFW